MNKRSIIALLLLATLPMLLGCPAAQESAEVAVQRSNMRALAAAYGSYQKNNRGRPPKSEKSFRAWIEKNGGALDYGAEDIDEMFISSRDDEPYVVIYGKPKDVVAYESVGVEGKRYIADNLGIVTEVDEATFREKVPDAE